nr:uncharacterized protein LOC118878647 [Drosophila suzukii]
MLFFHSLPCNVTEYPVSYRTDYCLPPPERRLSINNCPHRSRVGSYNNLRSYRPSSPTSTMQNPRFDRRRRPNYWSTVQLYGKMLHPNVAKPNVQSRCRLCVRSELADLTSTKRIVFASKLETHQRTPALGSSIHRSKRIDLIIRADLMASLILPGTRIGNADEPIAQNSHLGWMILGKFQDSIHTFNIRCHQTALDTELLLKNFCEIESVPSRSLHSDEERWCESFFKETHTRQLNGSFMSGVINGIQTNGIATRRESKNILNWDKSHTVRDQQSVPPQNDRKHLGWDDPVPSSIANKWKRFRVNLEDISKIRIPRSVRYTPDFSHDIQLHAFCDGSTHAYAEAVNMRIPQQDSSFYTTLITAKSKICPTKPLTIPRTELCGAVLATKLTKWVVANNRWKNDQISFTYWTDATIVLHWIKRDVTRSYILDHSDSNQWRHVPTADNPADSATRGLSPSEISIFDLWWQ